MAPSSAHVSHGHSTGSASASMTASMSPPMPTSGEKQPPAPTAHNVPNIPNSSPVRTDVDGALQTDWQSVFASLISDLVHGSHTVQQV